MTLTLQNDPVAKYSDAWKFISQAETEVNHYANWLGLNRTHPLDKMVVAYKHNCFAGFIAYRCYDEDKEVYISMAYVVPEFRRQGVHTAMFKYLVELVQKDYLVIHSGAALENITSIEAQKKRGSKIISVNTIYMLKRE